MTASPYGYCPQCGAPGIARERRIGGNDRCQKGHDYPSLTAVAEKDVAPTANLAFIPDTLRNGGSVALLTLTEGRLRLDVGTYEWDLRGEQPFLAEWFALLVACQPLDFERDIAPHFSFQG